MDRAPYKLTIANHTRGWSYEVTAGDEPDPAALVQLLDQASTSWSTSEQRPYSQLDPEQLTFRLAARTFADLPPIDYEDDIQLLAVRPTSPSTSTTFVDVFGSVSGLVLDSSTGLLSNLSATAIVLAVSVTGPTSLLERPVTFDERVSTDQINGPFGIAGTTARVLAQFGRLATVTYNEPYDDTISLVFAKNESLRTVVDRIMNGTRYPEAANTVSLPVLRCAHAWDVGAGWKFAGPASPYRYFTDFWTLRAAGVSRLFTINNTDDVIGLDLDGNELQDGVTVIPASLVSGNQQWQKQRATVRDTDLTVVFPTGDPASPGQEVKRYGQTGPQTAISVLQQSTETTSMSLYANDEDVLDHVFAAQLEGFEPPVGWSLTDLTVSTDLMDDAQWDRYCQAVFPPSRPGPYNAPSGYFGRPLVLVGALAEATPTGYLYSAVPRGCEITFQRGQVRSRFTLSQRSLRTVDDVPGVTVAAFLASPHGATTLRDQGGAAPYLDSRVSYDDIKTSTL